MLALPLQHQRSRIHGRGGRFWAEHVHATLSTSSGWVQDLRQKSKSKRLT